MIADVKSPSLRTCRLNSAKYGDNSRGPRSASCESDSTKDIPDTESLRDTYVRVTKYYDSKIKNNLVNGNILISAHGNSLRALCKYLFNLDEIQISNLEIPTGNPLLISLDKDKKVTDCKYLDSERAKDLVVF